MKMVNLLALAIFCIALTGCERIYGPVEDAKAFVAAKDDVMLQMGKKIEADPAGSGVEEARKIFESKRSDLKTKLDALRAKPEGMNADWIKIVTKSEDSEKQAFKMLLDKITASCSTGCSDQIAGITKLESDFKQLVSWY